MNKFRLQQLGVVAIIAVTLTGISAPAADASNYGQGGYSTCSYGPDCPAPTPTPTPAPTSSGTPTPSPAPAALPSGTPAPPTIIQTTSGLNFAVNLSNGQRITSPSFLVTVTPLNGEGQTAAKVEILINNQSAAVIFPDSTGTFNWLWNVPAKGNTTVSVILYDSNGKTTRQDIHVLIASPSSTAVSTPSGQSPGPLGSIATTINHIVHQIPIPIDYAIPYLLLSLLAAGLLLLVWQIRRETAEAESFAAALAHEQALVQDKSTFVQLASHYLRTPLSVMSGGLDILTLKKTIPAPQAESIKQAISALGAKVEKILNQSVQSSQTPSPSPNLPADRLRVWLKPGFLIPIVAVGILGFGFNALLAASGTISPSLVNTLTQLAIFSLLTGLLYIGLRTRALRRRNRARIEQLRAEQADIDLARNNLISGSVGLLREDLAAIKAQIVGLPDSEGAKLIRNGYRRFEVTLSKLAAAAKLEAGGTATEAPEVFSLATLLQQATSNSAAAAQAKQVQVELPADAQLAVRHPDWLGAVVASLLDNAVAYTRPGSTVHVAAASSPDHTTLTVTDEGPGLPADKLATLFKPFSRADGALVFDHEGLGFSLYLDRLMMNYLAGDISATSVPGHGLQIELSFPS